jgi:glycosyltransferase involved in cell wall biosynthesis
MWTRRMSTTTEKGEDARILLDLKPALDGFAGIPQESRLLFLGLRTMPGFAVDGLIQHGGRRLRAAVPPAGKQLTMAKRINRLSRVIVSLHERPYSNIFDMVTEAIEGWFSLSGLRFRALMGAKLIPGVFDGDLFEDFIWRTFFSKTLKPTEKAAVTKARFRVLKVPRKRLHQVGLAGMKYSSSPRYLKIDTGGYDVLLAQTPFPGRVSKGTQLVVRYHDMVPVLMPHTISDKAFHQASHFYALQDNVRAGAWFSCVSHATRQDLIKIFPEAEPRSVVIHNIVSDEYCDEPSDKGVVREIVRNRLAHVDGWQLRGVGGALGVRGGANSAQRYILMVSTLEPRKNHLALVSAWERLKYTEMPDLKLVVVGSLGWDEGPVLTAFRPWAERGDLFYLSNVPSAELRALYRHASATICPSLAEGFDYSGIEAMRSGGIVISSDIPVHREIYGGASAYFDPYSAEDAASVIGKVLHADAGALRLELQQEGARIADKYSRRNILPEWDKFLGDLTRGAGPGVSSGRKREGGAK